MNKIKTYKYKPVVRAANNEEYQDKVQKLHRDLSEAKRHIKEEINKTAVLTKGLMEFRNILLDDILYDKNDSKKLLNEFKGIFKL